MFVDFRNEWSMPERHEPIQPAPRVTKKQERMIARIIALNLVMLVVGPLAGVTIFDAVAALLRG